MSAKWRVVIEDALFRGRADLMIMPEWIQNSIQQWLDATRDQPVSLDDFIAYIGAVVGHQIETTASEESLTWQEVVSWMPSSVADAMGDLLADLKAKRELSIEKWTTEGTTNETSE